MKSVLVTATTFPRWKDDTEPRFVFMLSSLLAKKGYKVIVLAPHHFGAKKLEVMGNLKVYRFPYFYPSRLQRLCYEGGILENMKKSFLAKAQIPFLLASEFLYILQIIKKEKIDLMHAHWILPQGFIAAIIKKLCKVPYIATAHAGDIFPIKRKSLKLMANFAIKNSAYTTANSSFTKSSLLNIAKKDIEVIPMGVDLKAFSPKKKDMALRKKHDIKGKFILFVGRLAEKKGVEYLIRAMPFVIEKIPDSKLLIAGDGPERKKLESLADELKLKNNIIFAGKIQNKDLCKYYATADVFVGPSIVTKAGDTEGLGVVFLEAIASGACVIGANVGGIPDIIKNNETGLLVEEKNPEQLANAIIKLLTDKNMQNRLKSKAFKHIKRNYSWDNVADKFAKLYAKIK